MLVGKTGTLISLTILRLAAAQSWEDYNDNDNSLYVRDAAYDYDDYALDGLFAREELDAEDDGLLAAREAYDAGYKAALVARSPLGASTGSSSGSAAAGGGNAAAGGGNAAAGGGKGGVSGGVENTDAAAYAAYQEAANTAGNVKNGVMAASMFAASTPFTDGPPEDTTPPNNAGNGDRAQGKQSHSSSSRGPHQGQQAPNTAGLNSKVPGPPVKERRALLERRQALEDALLRRALERRGLY